MWFIQRPWVGYGEEHGGDVVVTKSTRARWSIFTLDIFRPRNNSGCSGADSFGVAGGAEIACSIVRAASGQVTAWLVVIRAHVALFGQRVVRQ